MPPKRLKQWRSQQTGCFHRLADQLVREHRWCAPSPEQAAKMLGDLSAIDILGGLSDEQLLEARYQKLMQFGVGRSDGPASLAGT